MEGLNGTEVMIDLIEEVAEAMNVASICRETREKTKIGYLMFWSESFLRCSIKHKENSVWILTVKIYPPEDQKSSSRHTTVLASGKSTDDLSKVTHHFMEEAACLMSDFQC